MGVQLHHLDGGPGLTILPVVRNARLALTDFHIRRISNAKGRVVEELGDQLREVIEERLDGPRLTAKLNRAIQKKRDRLTLDLNDLLRSSWWPLASLPDVRQATTLQR